MASVSIVMSASGSGEEAVLAVMEYIDGEAAGKHIVKMIEGGNAGGAAAAAVTSVAKWMEGAGQEADSKDVESIFSVLGSMVSNIGDEAQTNKATDAVLQMVTASKSTARAPLAIRILFNFFNFLPFDSARADILIGIMDYALAVGFAEKVASLLAGRLMEWMKEWKLENAKSRPLLATCADLCAAAGKDMEAASLSRKYLTSFQGCSPKELDSAAPVAVKAIAKLMTSPETVLSHQNEILSTEAVRNLANMKEYSTLYKAAKSMSAGDLAGYKAAITADPKVLKYAGYEDEDAAMAKMRVIALACLPNALNMREIPYSVVAEKLDIDVDDVESTVVSAIAARVMEARLDQINGIVTVNRSSTLIFGNEQWEELHSRLSIWKRGISRASAEISVETDTGSTLDAPPTGLGVSVAH